MTNKQVMQNIIDLAARQRDEGDSGQEFVATSMYAIASVCAASDFPKEEVKSLAAEAIDEGFKRMDEVAQQSEGK